MELLSTIAEIIRDLLIFVAVMTGLLVALVVVVSKMPDSNPLKRLLTALTYRVGATVAAGAFAVPYEPIPSMRYMILRYRLCQFGIDILPGCLANVQYIVTAPAAADRA